MGYFTVDSGTFNCTDGQNAYCYIEDALRSSGIKVDVPGEMFLARNQAVKFIGEITTDANGEPMLRIGEITDMAFGDAVAALGVSGNGLPGSGLDITGLLVRVWGKVTFANTTDPTAPMILYVDDGKGFNDGLGVGAGIRVLLPYDIGANLSSVVAGDTVAVSGLISKVKVGGKIVPVIRMREDADARKFSAQ